ncbi:phage portal protein [Paraclostridium sordellii]|uniref:phage portal protein n=1 Tax=Paraclostridium sordellii TaxID=1505 RepID=UPI00054282AC|nr:phage portal protein [Paeniclostridium sordellii]CEK34150.1 portal protein,phage portal protein, HK97 family,Phage portal protein [[Clostridium] sordellii] [Paeniclostridium sordellii]CEP40875.1 portal protein [[Clostridium] sordellii] [Paeniclostridium sordellii]
MNLIKSLKNLIMPKPQTVDMRSEKLLEWLGITTRNKNILSEVTYFTCLKMLSETLGKMPIKMYQETEKGVIRAAPNKVYDLLKVRPNPYMTPSIFWATVENNRNHFGNAYVYIRKEFKREKYGATYEIKNLWIMPSNDVQVIMDNKGIFGIKDALWYIYTDRYTGEQFVFKNEEVLHFKTSFTFDGILGEPVSKILKYTLEGGVESQNFINNLYKTGLTAKATLEYTGDLDKSKEDKLIEGISRFANGSDNAGKIIPIPLGMKITPLNIKLTDSQFYELKKFSSLQIAGAFGIKPNQINNYEKSSYSSGEMQQLSFYVDTEQFILKQYEEEICYKLLSDEEKNENKYYKFNEKAILRTDAKTQAECLTSFVNNAIYTPNNARDILDMPAIEGGDVLICNGNYIPITDVGKQYSKGGENSE